MKTTLLTSLFAAGIFFLYSCAPDLSEYQYLQDPQITTKPKQKMIIVELQGDPSITGKEAFSALISTFYKLKRM